MNHYDVFICHASEDKATFVRPLAQALRSHYLEVWYDEFTVEVGDSLREEIDKGLAASRYGVVVLSPSFFKKGWPKSELNGLVARETTEQQDRMILPIWHGVNREQVLQFSPMLADRFAVSSEQGVPAVVEQLMRRLRPEPSPLVVARNTLMEMGLSPPMVTDESWLDVVGIMEGDFLDPDLNPGWRWIFPLPFPVGAQGAERGTNIAWTALQMDWANDAERRNICQLTHPEIVHDYLRKWPGLMESVEIHPATLALYAPQLTIPGFDGGLADAFDALMSPDRKPSCEGFRYGRAETVDGKEPLCGEFVAWRHPKYGNYTPGDLSYQFVLARDTSFSRALFSGFECLVWLLSDASDWLPDGLRETLQRGFRERVSWWLNEEFDHGTVVDRMLHERPRSRFTYTGMLRRALLASTERALKETGAGQDAGRVVSRFIEFGFLEGHYEERLRIREAGRRGP